MKSRTRHNRLETPHKTASFDKPFFYATIMLFICGLLILSSASMAIAYKDHGSVSYYTLRQLLLGGVLGMAALFTFQSIPYYKWRHFALSLMILSFILLALVFVPQLGHNAGGAQRWLQFGPVNFQPSEILKLGFIVYLASWLDARRKEVGSVSYGMMPFAVMITIIGVFLMMQPDFGTFGVIVATAGIMYFLGGGKISQMTVLCGFGAVMSYMLIHLATYRSNRLLVFLNPSIDPKGIGYQINQALIAIGSGGLWGLGFGRSLQKYNYLPEPMTDSIFAIFSEEMGFVGILVLIALFGFFFWRAVHIAKKAPDIFGRLLVLGLAANIMAQVFINMAAISGLLPLTGIALPFVSYGSSSLAITMAMTGIILNVSKYGA